MAENAEKLLISSLLRDGDFATALGANISGDHFHAYNDEWTFLESYYSRHRRMPSKLAFKNKFPEFNIRPVDDTAHFCEEVRRSHIQHALVSSIKDVTDLITSGDPESAVKAMHSSIVKITAESGAMGDVDLISDWQQLFDEAQQKAGRAGQDGLAGISTGIPTVDDATGGYQPGELWVVAARLGEFKSWVLLNSAAAALVSGHSVQFVSLEMSRSQVGWRMHSLLSGKMGRDLFSNIELQQGRNFDARKYRAFLRDLPKTIKGSFNVTDGSRGRQTPTSVAAQIERNRPDVVFVDYIQLMGANEWQVLSGISGEFKSLCQQYQLPIVEAAQFNRERGIGKEPAGPEALGGSDAIGQDADGVISIKKMSESVVGGKLTKYRHGPSGQKFYIDARPGKGIFNEVSYNKAMDLQDRDMDALDEKEADGPPKPKVRTLSGRIVEGPETPRTARTVKRMPRP